MAKFFFGVQGPTLDFRSDFQIADTDAPRIMAYLMGSEYGKVTENVVSDVPDAAWSPGENETEADRPTIQTQAWVTRPATPSEAADNYAKAQFRSLLSATHAKEQQAAIATALAALTPIEPV